MSYHVHTVETYISLHMILLQTIESNHIAQVIRVFTVHTCDKVFFSIMVQHSIVQGRRLLKLALDYYIHHN